MKYIFSSSLPRSGHHAIEMYLVGCFGPEVFNYCEFYTIPHCCKKIPCARLGIRPKSAALFMQKSHDHDLADPVPKNADLLLIQIREPIVRMFSNYELELKTTKESHTRGCHVLWLARELMYQAGFINKWCRQPLERRYILKYEMLVEDPVGSMEQMLEHIGMRLDSRGRAVVSELKRQSSGGGEFRQRGANSDRFMDQELIQQAAQILSQTGGDWGYDLTRYIGAGAKNGILHDIFAAQQFFNARDYDRAFNIYERAGATLASPDLSIMMLRCKGDAGDAASANAIADAALAQWPYHTELVFAKAFLMAETQPEAVRNFLDRMAPQVTSPQRLTEFVRRTKRFASLDWQAPVSIKRLTEAQVKRIFNEVLGRDPESDNVLKNHCNVDSEDNLRKILRSSNEYNSLLPVEEVVRQFNELLGRAPESDAVLWAHRRYGSRDALRKGLMASSEYLLRKR